MAMARTSAGVMQAREGDTRSQHGKSGYQATLDSHPGFWHRYTKVRWWFSQEPGAGIAPWRGTLVPGTIRPAPFSGWYRFPILDW